MIRTLARVALQQKVKLLQARKSLQLQACCVNDNAFPFSLYVSGPMNGKVGVATVRLSQPVPYEELSESQCSLSAELNQAITNIIESDVGNSTPVHNPAQTGALRITANKKTELQDARAKHYHAKTIYTKNYTYITLYTLSVLASLIYIAVRIWYVANGFMRQEIPSNTRVVDTSTCVDSGIPIDSNECTNIACGDVDNLDCDNILAGDLLGEAGIDVMGTISPGDVTGDEFKGIREIMQTHTYSYWWSLFVLAAEIGGFILVHLSQQMFIRQDTKFYEMAPDRLNQLREV